MTTTPELFDDSPEPKITVETSKGSRELDIYTPEGFKVLSNLYTRSGWQQKISYEPTWLGIPIIQTPEDIVMMQELLWKVRPDVVVGWGSDGGYFHPDHIACGACTDEALAGAGVPLYHFVLNPHLAADYRRLVSWSGHDPAELKLCVWEKTSATFRCNTGEIDLKRRAIACHVSQMDDGWDRWIRGEVELPGLETESYMRVRDTNPAGLILESGLFAELS